jgi:hypothetical protein
VGAGVIGVQSAFLLFAGVGINSYGSAVYPTSAAISTLQRLVGPNLLGLDGNNEICPPGGASCGVRGWTGIGLYPEMNLDYGIDELAVHDPLTPAAYFNSWPVAGAGQDAGGANVFAPAVNSLSLARLYGVRYLLVQTTGGIPVPQGMRPVTTIEGPTKAKLTLVSVPGSSRFDFPAGRGRVLSSSHPGDATYKVRVSVPRGAPQRLVLRITDTPGWHVTDDGRALRVQHVDTTFLAVSVPAGSSTVVATYEPASLEVGFVLALAALAVLVVLVALEAGAGALGATRRRLRRGAVEGTGDPATPPES